MATRQATKRSERFGDLIRSPILTDLFTKAIALVAATLVAISFLGGTAIASGPNGSRTFDVVGYPINIVLPSTWTLPLTSQPGLAFLAFAPARNVYAGLAAGSRPPSSFASLAQYVIESERQDYLTRDPKATIRYRRTALAVGEAEQVIAVLRTTSETGSPMQQEVDSYWFQHLGHYYNFSCVFPVTQTGTYLPICKAAARLMRYR